MSAVIELFGHPASSKSTDWDRIVREQRCPFLGKKCYKVRKSDPDISIGSCTVLYGKQSEPVLICPERLTQRGRIFADCIHLLTLHEPGNELHVVSEVQIPGGNVDYFLVSAKNGIVMDFAGIELQTLDTTGTVWPERQRLLRELGLPRGDDAENSDKRFGMNWKMTAKTILVQMHHKIRTFEHVRKTLVLVVQDALAKYMEKEFEFGHLRNPASSGHSMHLHIYEINRQTDGSYKLDLTSRLSTDADGIRRCLGLQAEARMELPSIAHTLQARIGPDTIFNPVHLYDVRR